MVGGGSLVIIMSIISFIFNRNKLLHWYLSKYGYLGVKEYSERLFSKIKKIAKIKKIPNQQHASWNYFKKLIRTIDV